MPFKLGTNRIGSVRNGSNTIGNGFVDLSRVWGGGPNGDTPAPPTAFSPVVLLDGHTAGYTLIAGTEGTSNIIENITGTGLTLNNIYAEEPAYIETTYCAALRSDTTLTQDEQAYLRIESNGGVYFAPNYPCTNLTGNQAMIYGLDTNVLNINISNGFSAIVIARKLNIGGDEGNENLLSLGFDSNTRWLQFAGLESAGEDVILNRWYWNDNPEYQGSMDGGLQDLDTSQFVFSAISSGTNNLSNKTSVLMSDGQTYASGDLIIGGGENVSATTLNSLVINRNYYETTYPVSAFTGKDWDIAAIMVFNYPLGQLQMDRIYRYYKEVRGYNMY